MGLYSGVIREMATHITPRDRVWAAVREQTGEFRRRDVWRTIRYQTVPAEAAEGLPSDETIKRTLSAMVDLGVLEHERHSAYYRLARRRASR